MNFNDFILRRNMLFDDFLIFSVISFQVDFWLVLVSNNIKHETKFHSKFDEKSIQKSCSKKESQKMKNHWKHNPKRIQQRTSNFLRICAEPESVQGVILDRFLFFATFLESFWCLFWTLFWYILRLCKLFQSVDSERPSLFQNIYLGVSVVKTEFIIKSLDCAKN